MGKIVCKAESNFQNRNMGNSSMKVRKFRSKTKCQMLLDIISLLILFLVIFYCATVITAMCVHSIEWRSDLSMHRKKTYIINVLNCWVLYSISAAILYKTVFYAFYLRTKNQKKTFGTEFWLLSPVKGFQFLLIDMFKEENETADCEHYIFEERNSGAYNSYLVLPIIVVFFLFIGEIIFIFVTLDDKKVKTKTKTKKTKKEKTQKQN